MSLAAFIRQHPAARRAVEVGRRHRLTVALTIAVVAAFVLTGVSVSMYYIAGFYRYDLSRPGFEKERAELAKPEPQKAYDTTSPVTKATIDDFLKEFDSRQNDLSAYGSFHDTNLSDEDLQLLPPTEGQ